jgi:lysyl-tRNA synthetase class II
MSYKDYFEAEEPTWNVFTEEEIELGDLPKADAVAAPKKDDRQAKKNERLAARQNKGAAQAEENKKDPNDPSAALFGERELNKSQGDPELRFTKKWVKIKDIDESIAGQEIIVRGRLHNSRAKGALAFFIVREQFSTIQAILKAEDKISKGMVTYASKVPKESIIEVKAKVVKSEQPVETCSQKVEL